MEAKVTMLQTAVSHKCHLSSQNMKKAYKKYPLGLQVVQLLHERLFL